MTDGPLDLTVPLNIAEVRAALATTGPLRRVGLAAYVAGPKSASVGHARPHDGRGHGGDSHGHRRIGALHPPSSRLGRIFAFVAVAAALSIGTAYALVLSNNAQNTSVSLPATGAIPVAPSTKDPQPGQVAGDSGSTSAQTTPSPSRSTGRQAPVAGSTTNQATPSSSATSTGTATTDPSTSASAGSSASSSATASAPAGFGPAPTGGSGTQWQVLYPNQGENSTQQQETTDVQSLLLEIGYLTPWHHRSYVDPAYASAADSPGQYGSATATAVAQFQQNYGVEYTAQLGACDEETYEVLFQVYEQAQAAQ